MAQGTLHTAFTDLLEHLGYDEDGTAGHVVSPADLEFVRVVPHKAGRENSLPCGLIFVHKCTRTI
jgi:hypothetical protein